MKKHLIDIIGGIGIALMMSGVLAIAFYKYAGIVMIAGIALCGVATYKEYKEM